MTGKSSTETVTKPVGLSKTLAVSNQLRSSTNSQ